MNLAVLCWRPVAVLGQAVYENAFTEPGAPNPFTIDGHLTAGYALIDAAGGIGTTTAGVIHGEQWLYVLFPLQVDGSAQRVFSQGSSDQYVSTGRGLRVAVEQYLLEHHGLVTFEELLVIMHMNHDFQAESSKLATGLMEFRQRKVFVDARYTSQDAPNDKLTHIGDDGFDVFEIAKAALAGGAATDLQLQTIYDEGIGGQFKSSKRAELVGDRWIL